MSSFVALLYISFLQTLCSILHTLRLPFVKTAALFTSCFTPPAEDSSLPLPVSIPRQEQTKKGSRFRLWPRTTKGKPERLSSTPSSLSRDTHPPRLPRLLRPGNMYKGKFSDDYSEVEKGLSAERSFSSIDLDYSPVHKGASPTDHAKHCDLGEYHHLKHFRSAPCFRARSDFEPESIPPSPTLFLGRSPVTTASPNSSIPASPTTPASPGTPVVKRYGRTAHLFPPDDYAPVKPEASTPRSEPDQLDDVDRLIIEMQRELARSAKNSRRFSDQVRLSLMAVDDDDVV